MPSSSNANSKRVLRAKFGPDGRIQCKCNLDTREFTVKKPGPNRGRSFYKCRKNDQNKSKCSLWLWADEVILPSKEEQLQHELWREENPMSENENDSLAEERGFLYLDGQSDDEDVEVEPEVKKLVVKKKKVVPKKKVEQRKKVVKRKSSKAVVVESDEEESDSDSLRDDFDSDEGGARREQKKMSKEIEEGQIEAKEEVRELDSNLVAQVEEEEEVPVGVRVTRSRAKGKKVIPKKGKGKGKGKEVPQKNLKKPEIVQEINLEEEEKIHQVRMEELKQVIAESDAFLNSPEIQAALKMYGIDIPDSLETDHLQLQAELPIPSSDNFISSSSPNFHSQPFSKFSFGSSSTSIPTSSDSFTLNAQAGPSTPSTSPSKSSSIPTDLPTNYNSALSKITTLKSDIQQSHTELNVYKKMNDDEREEIKGLNKVVRNLEERIEKSR